MSPDKDYMIEMLARQVLGIVDYSKGAHLSPTEVSSAQAEVEINLKSMVRGIRQRIWIDSAAIAMRAQEAVERALADANVDAVIIEAVRDEIASAKLEIRDRVRKVIDGQIQLAIAERIGDAPKKLANKIVGDMVDQLWTRLLAK